MTTAGVIVDRVMSDGQGSGTSKTSMSVASSTTPEENRALLGGEPLWQRHIQCGPVGWKAALAALGAFAVAGLVAAGIAALDSSSARALPKKVRGGSFDALPSDMAPPMPSRGIAFVSAETRGAPLLGAPASRFEQSFRSQVVNIGVGKTWTGYRMKVELFAAYLRSRLAMVGYTEPGQVEQELVVFVDGADVFYGGCSPSAFQAAYAEISAKSGASVIFSAEVVCGEQNCDRVPAIPHWAARISDVKNLDSGFWKKYEVGCNGTWTNLIVNGTPCAEERDCGYWATCSVPPAVKFLNSGVIVGPIKDLSDMMEWTLRNYARFSVWGDQSVFSQYWLDNPDKVTLDYTGELVLSLSDMSHDILKISGRDSSKITNQAFGHLQCLIHGNGRGRYLLRELVRNVTSLSLEQARGF
mmetsp:Transcript_146350/g.469508  ORF Transcript_146350/g.469508 Transcript_146350/m.469508 type:complete len:413 (-) Transcript_146350:48-1286(-)